MKTLLRREMDQALRPPGDHPDRSTVITRRTFLHKSLLYGTAGAATFGLFPLLNTIDMAFAQGGQSFKFAWISDTHLYPKNVNTRFVEKAVRAIQEAQAMNPPADFLIFGGDMAQLGDPIELQLGAELLKEIKIKKVFIPGEHDWYLDMGATWNKMFGTAPWFFDHKGVRFIGLETVSRAQDFWTSRKMSAKERMGHMATLDGTLGGAWAAVGPEQLKWLNSTLASWGKDKPVVIFSHNPLYEYFPTLELLGTRLARSARDPETLQQCHQHPRTHAPGAVQRNRQATLDRHARDLVAVALRARGRAYPHQAHDPRGPR